MANIIPGISNKALLLGVIILAALLFCRCNYTSNVWSMDGFQGSQGTNTFTLFYASWCPHCKDVKPVFQSWGVDKGSIQINGKPVFIEMVESEDKGAKEKMNSLQVKGFPTFVLQKADGSHKEFDGERTPAGWEAWLKSNI